MVFETVFEVAVIITANPLSLDTLPVEGARGEKTENEFAEENSPKFSHSLTSLTSTPQTNSAVYFLLNSAKALTVTGTKVLAYTRICRPENAETAW